MMNKIDFKKTLDAYQARRGQFRIADVPTPVRQAATARPDCPQDR